MKILEVIPFGKGIPGMQSPTLSYFSGKEVSEGSMVSIPLRGKSTLGLVVATREAADERAELRSSPFPLRKISGIVGKSIFSDAFVKSAEALAEFYLSSPGEIIREAVPALLFEKYKEFKIPRAAEEKNEKENTRFKAEKLIFQREFDERIDLYKTLIRTELARGASVFIVVPTIEGTEGFAALLSRGIERYTHVLHGAMTKKELLRRHNKAVLDKHPVLIISTPSFLFIHRADISTIVVEHESSGAYRLPSRPYFDFRHLAELIAFHGHKKLVLADTLLQFETLNRYEKREFVEFAPLKWRLSRTAVSSLVDTRKKDAKFTLISDEAAIAIEGALARGGRVLVYAARRGLHPLTVCKDCGTTLACSRCDAPLVLHGQSAGERVFVCHKCKQERGADLPCEHCQSWRLSALGYGTESVAAELKERLPAAEVRVFDKDSASTPQKARALALWFEDGRGKILVGTEMALHYTARSVDTIVVASIDSLASIPSFRISEKIFRTLMALRLRSERAFILQTRLEHKKVLEQALEGDLLNFYRGELADRIEYKYPPAVRVIKVTLEGKKPKLDLERRAVTELLAPYAPDTYSAFISKVKHLYRVHVVMRLAPQTWPLAGIGKGEIDAPLVQILRSLPPHVAVRIDPEDLL